MPPKFSNRSISKLLGENMFGTRYFLVLALFLVNQVVIANPATPRASDAEAEPGLGSTEEEPASDTTNVMETSPAVRPGELSVDSLPGCGQACIANEGCLFPCNCNLQGTVCIRGDCIDIFKCTG
ncbi:hypothetical protein GALMADRAFT_145951 [Galerina marginata CBS 339.88]|uniref:Uncharacterized protein n=1 Tax=Galerina marginata (strain CBS 339.88) TaxID=685588 RepID=A0A067SDF8_GALM3|nr:hypothetical protein GALMADRAFT_145951 [Galerina marginata CBS 339.88]